MTTQQPLGSKEASQSDLVTGARVLVIDDSPSVIHHVQKVLESEGHKVETLDLLIELGQKVRTNPPDLILLDLQMPALSGTKVGELISKFQVFEIPIVIYSSRPLLELQDACSKIGAVAYVEKGTSDTQLLAAVNRAFKESSLRRRVANV